MHSVWARIPVAVSNIFVVVLVLASPARQQLLSPSLHALGLSEPHVPVRALQPVHHDELAVGVAVENRHCEWQ